MALPASGNLSLSEIEAEFGGATPPGNLRAYLKGAGYVTTSDTAPNVPTSGDLALRDFLGAAKASSGGTMFYPSGYDDVGSEAWGSPTSAYASDSSAASCTPGANSATYGALQLHTFKDANGTGIASVIGSGATINWAKIHLRGRFNDVYNRQPAASAAFYGVDTVLQLGTETLDQNTPGVTSLHEYIGDLTTGQVRADFLDGTGFIQLECWNFHVTMVSTFYADCAWLEIDFTP